MLREFLLFLEEEFLRDLSPVVDDEDGEVGVEGVEGGGFDDGDGAEVERFPEAVGVEAGAAGADGKVGGGEGFEVGGEGDFAAAVAEGLEGELFEEGPSFGGVVLDGVAEVSEVVFGVGGGEGGLEGGEVAEGVAAGGDAEGDGVEFGVGGSIPVDAEPGEEFGVVEVGGEAVGDGAVGFVGDEDVGVGCGGGQRRRRREVALL